MYKALITDPVDKECVNRLRSAGIEVTEAYDFTRDLLLENIPKYDILIVRSRTKVDKQVIEKAERLKVIGRVGVGLDNIDVNEAAKKGIKVLSTPEASTIAVAELVFALLLSLARSIPKADNSMKQGRWIKGELHGFELRGKTLGIVGFGRIGRAVAKRAKAFEMHVVAYDPFAPQAAFDELGVVRYQNLKEMLAFSDIVSIHVPLTRETEYMFNEDVIFSMKRGSILINTSRGKVVDTKALLKALKSGHLAAAALDVYENEPPREPWEHELISLPNVVCTPHIGAQTVEAQRIGAILIAENIIKTLTSS
ncbi:MAG: 3-phosphoglycerate dehydrogenase [Candidatus Methanomethylicota archaeon]|uniref:3-phosphoglycerate dehydrogenase n=1 Tax=Thermoproteota archaeon TaxID=2056631 RepID=A0A497ETA4_9CREN|nr:MAG: 3-phosphoglycerate dehydrogenase [Candidatus Verstraetearchaeota archaeon]